MLKNKLSFIPSTRARLNGERTEDENSNWTEDKHFALATLVKQVEEAAVARNVILAGRSSGRPWRQGRWQETCTPTDARRHCNGTTTVS